MGGLAFGFGFEKMMEIEAGLDRMFIYCFMFQSTWARYSESFRIDG